MKMFHLSPFAHRCSALGLLSATLLTAALPCAQAADRFVVKAGGAEILDNSTGLIWQRCAEGQGWNGGTCTGSPALFTWQHAIAHAQSTAASSGKTWRLPNRKELSSLADRSGISPTIDTTAFPGASADLYWSSTPVAGEAAYAGIVNFSHGGAASNLHSDSLAVRLVRAGR